MSVLQIKRNNTFQITLCMCISMFSFLVSLLILSDSKKPTYYSSLFLLPLFFSVLSLVFNMLYNAIPYNLAITLITALFFVRTVCSPLFMAIGHYSVTIYYGVENNTNSAVFLVIYEMLCVFLVMYIMYRNSKGKPEAIIEEGVQCDKKGIRIYGWIVIVLMCAVLLCNVITPQLLSSYRTIFDIKDEFFTNFEDSQVVEKYGTTFIKKLSLVAGQYLVRAIHVILPAYCMIRLSKKQKVVSKFICFLCCFFPLFLIGGSIARSLINTICLMFLYRYLYGNIKISMKSVRVLIVGAVAVIIWWCYKTGAEEAGELFSKRFSAYFSGVNVVSGVFNLPDSVEYRIRYFLYDFFSTVPFGGTIFGITEQRVQPFFNEYNFSYGQIPTTIGMAYYYFGALISPIYSMIFAGISVNAAERLNLCKRRNPMKYMRLLLISVYFSMGIIMYNIEITMINLFSLILPLYILERISFGRGE